LISAGIRWGMGAAGFSRPAAGRLCSSVEADFAGYGLLENQFRKDMCSALVMNTQFSTNAVCGVCKQSYKRQALLFAGGFGDDFIESPPHRPVKNHARHRFGENARKAAITAGGR
jgi:hypothetical protein